MDIVIEMSAEPPIDCFQPKRGSWTALQLGRALSGGPRTLTECARALGREPGSVQGKLEELVSEKAVVKDPEDAGQGTQYELTPSARPALEEVLARSGAPGQMIEGLRLIEVTAESPRQIRSILGRRDLYCLTWAVRINAVAERWLLAASPSASELELERLRQAFDEAGGSVRRLDLVEVLYGRALQRQTDSVLDLA